MAEAANEIDAMEVPEGGIADFVMSDAEADEVYGPDEDGTEEFGDEGIAQFPALTKKMAAMGREGDDTIAHVQTGELIIPAAFLEDNPEMKDTIFAFLEAQGIEDPERYVVGSDANSLNPDTGAPEFFFKWIKKAVKAVVKGIKNVVKGVVKVIKKIAPIVLPIIGTAFLGPIYGAALGSGIATLINGGSIKDALKSGLMAGAMGGLTAGVGSAMSGNGFMTGVKNAAALGNVSAGMQGIGKALTGDFSGASFANMKAGPTAEGGTAFAGADLALDPALASQQIAGADTVAGGTNVGADTVAGATNVATDGVALTADQIKQQALDINTYKPPGFGESIKQAFTPGDGVSFGEGMKNAFMPNAGAPTATDFLVNNGINPINASAAQQAGARQLAGEASAGLMRTYGPAALLGTAGVAAAGGFTAPPQEEAGVVERDEDGNVITGTDLVEADPSQYMIADLGNRVLDPETGTYISKAEADRRAREEAMGGIASLSTYQPPEMNSGTQPGQPQMQTAQLNPNAYFLQGSTPSGPFARPFVGQTLADGGQVFPRRNGGIMPNEGVPNQDSVRAMLMPGEFVMTTDAVKGLGNGDMNSGIKNMYSVMRNLENRGRATA